MRRADLVAAAILLAIAAYGGYLIWRTAEDRPMPMEAILGDPVRALQLMVANGCAGCHQISGVPGARGTTGPPLDGILQRSYIGGVVRNTPENLIRWIRFSRNIDPKTAMPSTAISEEDARHIAAYLYQLK